MESGLVTLANSGSTSLHCSDGWQCVSSSQLSVRLLASNASSSCGTGVGSLLPPPSKASSHSSCSRLWLIGNRKFQCRIGCTLPHQWDIPHTLVGLDRAAAPPHTPYSPTCSGFHVGLEGTDTD